MLPSLLNFGSTGYKKYKPRRSIDHTMLFFLLLVSCWQQISVVLVAGSMNTPTTDYSWDDEKPKDPSRFVLERSTPFRLSIERNLVPPQVVQDLYQSILETASPGPRDFFHRSLLGFKGDAGAPLTLEQTAFSADAARTAAIFSPTSTNGVALTDRWNRAMRFQELRMMTSLVTSTSSSSNSASSSVQQQESGILRIEYLNQKDLDRCKELIEEVVPNNVLAEDGTIHLYISKPNSAALANHTDPTDIFVLQLMGSKEWLFCQDHEDEEDFMAGPFYGVKKSTKNKQHEKLSQCTTYNAVEMSEMNCFRETIYPGDALFLPKRVVHSARATPDGPTAHLTFAFADNTCSQEEEEENERTNVIMSISASRFLAETCDKSDGGEECNEGCTSNCGSCFSGCDDSCDAFCVGSCTGGCDSSCDDNCHDCTGDCDTSCNVCPPTTPAPSISPTKIPTLAPTRGFPSDVCPELILRQGCEGTRMAETYNVTGNYKPTLIRCTGDHRWDDSDVMSTVYRSEFTVTWNDRDVHVWIFRNGESSNRWIVDANADDVCGGSLAYGKALEAEFTASTTQPYLETGSEIFCEDGKSNGDWAPNATSLVLECNENAAIPTPRSTDTSVNGTGPITSGTTQRISRAFGCKTRMTLLTSTAAILLFISATSW